MNLALSLLLVLIAGVVNAQQSSSYFLPGKDNGSTFQQIQSNADKGDAQAQVYLGLIFMNGSSNGTTNDYKKAAQLLRRATEQGNSAGQLLLGAMYNDGLGTERNYPEAAKWYRKAAVQGDPEAEYLIATYLGTGQGGETNLIEAAKWCFKAAQQNVVDAEFSMGTIYLTGSGVPTNREAASTWYKMADQQVSIPAQMWLGRTYYNGESTGTNYQQAASWFQLAAEKGSAEAQRILAGIYIRGDGVPKDYSRAFKWAYESANQGDPVAQCMVGIAYLISLGTSHDEVAAYKWFNLSAAQGNQVAKSQLANLEQQMSPDQVAKGQEMSREFEPNTSSTNGISAPELAEREPQIIETGSGFFITDDGYLISNYHVVKDAKKVSLFMNGGLIDAKVVHVDEANDSALLKSDGQFVSLPIAASRSVALVNTVTTVGFPDIVLQGLAPKFSKGEISSLSGAQDDPRYFQISVPPAAWQFRWSSGG